MEQKQQEERKQRQQEERKQRQREGKRVRAARYRATKKLEWEVLQRENAELRNQLLETKTTMNAVLDHLLVNHPEQWLDVQSIVHQDENLLEGLDGLDIPGLT